MHLCAALVVMVLATLQVAQSSYFTCSKHPNGTFVVENVRNESGIATALYEDVMSTTGWAFLTVSSNQMYSDYDQMYCAGFLEGAITRDNIFAFYTNILACEYNNTEMSDEVTDWINANIAFMNAQIKANPTDPYWTHVSLVMTQLKGVIDGYNTYTTDESKKLSLMDFMLINMDGDMSDVEAALNSSFVNWNDDRAVIERYIYNSHCSSLVKVASDLSDIFAGHTTWEGYCEMVRVFKTYNLSISVDQSSQVVMFSGYPGSLSSVDDYYQMDTKLVVMETTNGIMNNSLYSAVTPNSVLSWIRAIVSNKMASNGKEWVSIFSNYNSGTYNNQWIVVDMKKLVVGDHLEPGTLWILEQIPGYIESADVTETLSYGYWPSYNVPYFPLIYNISGFPYYATTYGPFFSYENNPRAEIFRRDSNKVDSIDGIRAMLRYNDFMHDPLSQGNPGMAISSRFDLVTGNQTNPFLTRSAFGGVDSKVTSATLVNSMSCSVESCPTHDNLPPFEYTKEWESVSHVGQPSMWDFKWVDVQYTADGLARISL